MLCNLRTGNILTRPQFPSVSVRVRNYDNTGFFAVLASPPPLESPLCRIHFKIIYGEIYRLTADNWSIKKPNYLVAWWVVGRLEQG